MTEGRRKFLKLAPAAVPGVFAAAGVARADEGRAKEFLGAWNTKHDLPAPPNFFHEFLTFENGGILHETNSFLYTTSRVNFAGFGLTAPQWQAVNASDGFGSWEYLGHGAVQLMFRKMLFDGNTGAHFGDLLVSGKYFSDGRNLTGTATIKVVGAFDDDGVLVDFGAAGSHGFRIV